MFTWNSIETYLPQWLKEELPENRFFPVWAIIYIILYHIGFVQFGSIGSFAILPGDIWCLFFYVVLFKKMLWNGFSLKYSSVSIIIPLLFIIFPVLLSSISAFSSAQGLVQYIKSTLHFIFVWALAIFWAGLSLRSKSVLAIFKTYIIIAFPIALYALYQIPGRPLDWPYASIVYNNVSLSNIRGSSEINEASSQLALSFENFTRATSIYSEPSALSMNIVQAFVLIFSPFLKKIKGFVSHSEFISLLVLLALAQFFSFSTTGYIYLLIIGICWFFLENKKRVVNSLIVIFCVVVFVYTVGIFIKDFVDIDIIELTLQKFRGITIFGSKVYLERPPGDSTTLRLLSVSTAFEEFYHSPVWGCGLGLFYLLDLARIRQIYFVDGTFQDVLVQLGIVGFISFIAIYISLFLKAFRLNRMSLLMKNNSSRILTSFLFYYILYLILNNISANSFILLVFWFHIGLVSAALNAINTEINENIVFEFRAVSKPWNKIVVPMIKQMLLGNKKIS